MSEAFTTHNPTANSPASRLRATFFGASHGNIVAITAANGKRRQVRKIVPKRRAEASELVVKLTTGTAKSG
jgi:uncharacterized protein Veg